MRVFSTSYLGKGVVNNYKVCNMKWVGYLVGGYKIYIVVANCVVLVAVIP